MRRRMFAGTTLSRRKISSSVPPTVLVPAPEDPVIPMIGCLMDNILAFGVHNHRGDYIRFRHALGSAGPWGGPRVLLFVSEAEILARISKPKADLSLCRQRPHFALIGRADLRLSCGRRCRHYRPSLGSGAVSRSL